MSGTGAPLNVDEVRAWPGILRRPRPAMRAAVEQRSWLGPLAVLAVSSLADVALQRATGYATMPAGAALRALALGMAWLPVLALMAHALARLAGGRGTLMATFVVTAWSLLPAALFSLPVDLVGLAVYRSEWWAVADDFSAHILSVRWPVVLVLLHAATIAIGLWCLALWIEGTAEVHGLSERRVFLVVAAPLFALGMIAAITAALLVASMGATPG
jgi:hypothetical protein